MIVYNVTVNINHDVEQDWVQWMSEKHIPDVMNTGVFTKFKFLRLNDPIPEEGTTYAVQYFTPTKEHLEHYQANFAPALQQDALEKFPNKFVAFRTILEVIGE